jgi:hypothetical protein
MPAIPILTRIGLFFWRNPYAAIVLLLAVGWGVLKWQGYQIDGLKLENERLVVTVKSERAHHEKVVTAFKDKGVKDDDRQKFTKEAATSVAGKYSGAAPSPALRDAYKRVYERLASRTAASTR